MLITITTSRAPATDLGYLLHKHPQRVQTFDVSVGTAHVFYPEATEERCTVALLLEVDPIALVRGRGKAARDGFALGQYVNDRPYATSSMFSVAVSRVFKTAMAGRCDARPDLAAAPMPLEIHVPAMPCAGGPAVAARLFEPLGWGVEATAMPLDETIPAWGDSRYVDLRLTGEVRLADALNHLYVLLPVVDDAKHYWVSTDEVDKLVRAGEGWLASHPAKEMITSRYLKHRFDLTQTALGRLAEVDDTSPDQVDNAVADGGVVDEPERPTPLSQQRRRAVLEALRSAGARRVGDLGCGEGALVGALLADASFTEVLATDVSARALQVAGRRLHLDTMPDRQRERLELFQSSLTHRDDRLAGLDAAVLMEVIEHVDLPRLPALERNVFGVMAPVTVIVTTPNADHNERFEMLAAGNFRHHDHRFEWTRAEFGAWTRRIAATYAYELALVPVGQDDPDVGPPTQMAIFSRLTSSRPQRLDVSA